MEICFKKFSLFFLAKIKLVVFYLTNIFFSLLFVVLKSRLRRGPGNGGYQPNEQQTRIYSGMLYIKNNLYAKNIQCVPQKGFGSADQSTEG